MSRRSTASPCSCQHWTDVLRCHYLQPISHLFRFTSQVTWLVNSAIKCPAVRLPPYALSLMTHRMRQVGQQASTPLPGPTVSRPLGKVASQVSRCYLPCNCLGTFIILYYVNAKNCAFWTHLYPIPGIILQPIHKHEPNTSSLHLSPRRAVT